MLDAYIKSIYQLRRSIILNIISIIYIIYINLKKEFNWIKLFLFLSHY